MRDYAKVVPKMWHGETVKVLRKMGPEALLVGLYLITSPSSNMLGLFPQPILYMAHETGLGEEGARKGLACCIEAGFCSYDFDADMVWVHEMATYQIADELKATDLRCKGIQKDYEALPNNAFLGAFFDRYAEAFHLSKRRDFKGSIKGPSKPLAKPHRSQEQEQEQEQDSSAPIGAGGKPPAEPGWPSPPPQTLDLVPPAPPKPDKPKDPVKEEIWQAGRSVLIAGGVAKDQAGSFLGSLVQTYGQPVVLEAVRAAVVNAGPDPRGYLKATCMRLMGERKAQASASPAQQARIDRMAEAVPGLATGRRVTTIDVEAKDVTAAALG